MFSTKSVISVLVFSVAMVMALGIAGNGVALAECVNDSEFT